MARDAIASRILSEVDRATIVSYVQDLESTLNSVINPQLTRFNLGYLTDGTDAQLIQWWKQHTIIKEDSIKYELNIRRTRVEVEPMLPISVIAGYGYIGGDERALRHRTVATNLVKATDMFDQMKPFVDLDKKQILPDKLKDAAQTFFYLPEEAGWYPLYSQPTFQSDVIGIIGKYGDVKLLTSSFQLQVYLNGRSEILVTSPPMQIANLP